MVLLNKLTAQWTVCSWGEPCHIFPVQGKLPQNVLKCRTPWGSSILTVHFSAANLCSFTGSLKVIGMLCFFFPKAPQTCSLAHADSHTISGVLGCKEKLKQTSKTEGKLKEAKVSFTKKKKNPILSQIPVCALKKGVRQVACNFFFFSAWGCQYFFYRLSSDTLKQALTLHILPMSKGSRIQPCALYEAVGGEKLACFLPDCRLLSRLTPNSSWKACFCSIDCCDNYASLLLLGAQE